MNMQREQLEAAVLIVGAGPAGLACALHLANLIKRHNARGDSLASLGASKPEFSAENIYVLEKSREFGPPYGALLRSSFPPGLCKRTATISATSRMAMSSRFAWPAASLSMMGQ